MKKIRLITRCRWPAAALLIACLILLHAGAIVIAFSPNANNHVASISTSKLHAATSEIHNQFTHSTENIIVEEAELNQQIDENLTILFAARIPIDDEHDDYLPCEGLLLQKNSDERNIHRYQAHITTACHPDKDSLDHFLAVFHKLLIQYLLIENDLYKQQLRNNDGGASAVLTISLDNSDDSATASEVHLHLEHIGFSFLTNDEAPNDVNDGIQMDLSSYAPFLNSYIIRHRGTEQGNASLILHKMLCERRVSYQFSHNQAGMEEQSQSSGGRRRNVVSHHPSVLSPSVINEVQDILDVVKSKQWLSTNPDSVDGLPSLHLNLITNGKPLFDINEEEEETTSLDDPTTFPQCIKSLVKVLQPHLYDTLLPAARKVLNSSTVEISDVFIRNYGVQPDQDENDNDESSKTRFGLSPHFDVTAYATCVMALDAVASSGQQGLYTIPPTNGFHTSSAVLKKFFPLEKGDGVVHTFDILHGVDVDPQLNLPRTSLIVWFTDTNESIVEEEEDVNSSVNQPWLLKPAADDDIGQFVLALASERTVEEDGSHLKLKSAVDPLQLYISSAARGNVFAMTALGQMCDDGLVPDDECNVIRDFLITLDSSNPYIPNNHSTEESRSNKMANALWYHAAIQGGHRVAQVSLADNLMLQYMTDESQTSNEKESMILMASILLTQALHQGYNSLDMLHRIRNVECSRLANAGVEIPSEEFFQSAVIQVLLLSMS